MAPNPAPAVQPMDPTAAPVDPATAGAGQPADTGALVYDRPPPPGSGLIIGGFGTAGPGVVMAAVGLLFTATRTPGGPLFLGVGGVLALGGGGMLGLGFYRYNKHDRWAKDNKIRVPRSGHGLITGGGLAAGAGIALVTNSAIRVSRSPRGEVCDENGCTNPRFDEALGIGVGITVLGGAATLLGIGIKRKLRYDRWMRDPAPLTPNLTLLPGGGGLSLSGKF